MVIRPGPASAGSGRSACAAAGRIVRGRAPGRSRRRALSPLRRRRRDDSRPLGAGAQEARREVRGQRQLLHGHGHERFHRRGSVGASEYKEERNQYSLGVEYLRGKTTYNLSYTNSKENDYKAETTSFGISQDLFGDLTTISMGFSRGKDVVRRRETVTDQIDPTFKEPIDRWSYRVGVSQILTKSLISSLQLEVITDEGFLNNPYRSYRFVNPTDARLFALAREVYPRTRTSNAVAFNARYYLPYRAAVHGGYRFFTDTWGIDANTFEAGYTHPVGAVDLRGRLPLLHAGQRRFLRRPVRPPQPAELPGARQGAVDVRQPGAQRGRDLRLPAERLALHQEGHAQHPLRPHRVRLRRLPRRALRAAAGLRPELPRGGHRAAVHLRRQRHPGVRVGLVLRNAGPESG